MPDGSESVRFHASLQVDGSIVFDCGAFKIATLHLSLTVWLFRLQILAMERVAAISTLPSLQVAD